MATTSSTPHPYPRPERETAVPLLSAGELRDWLNTDAPPFLLDVRRASERALAHLPGDGHIPLHDLALRLSEVPGEGALVTYCHYGSDARRAAEFLRSRGRKDVFALEGGIDEFARLVDPGIPRYENWAPDHELMLVQLPRPDSGCLTYLLGDPVNRAAVIVDPGREVDPYVRWLDEGRWSLRAIVETHTHADHLAGHDALHRRTGAPIYLGRQSPAQYPHKLLTEGDRLAFGEEVIEVLETPGHTRDHLSLKVRDKVFTGDTLLIGSCGRTDLGDGNPESLWESLTEKLLRLPDETEVLPAHFGKRHALVERYASSIGFERATNEALRSKSRADFLAYMSEGWPPKPTDFDRIVHENLER